MLNAWPDEPRIENAVMFVPNRESRNTYGPSDRLATKNSSAFSRPVEVRKAKIPI